jgi:acyl-CoA thioester hydrolase
VGRPLEYPLRVRYSECDMQGVVFNANYLAFFDVSMTELWRAAFGSYQVMIDRGVDLVVASAGLQFSAPARFDDELTIGIGVGRLGSTSIITRHTVRRGEDDVATGEMCHVFVDATTLAKTPIPEWARDGLRPWVLA